MMGATVKNHYAKLSGLNKDELFVVSVVPCIAKKYEAARPEFAEDGIRDVDAVLTTTELLEMVRLRRIEDIVPAEFDEPYKQVSGAGVLFGASGGVAEAALRMAVEKLTGEPMTEHLDFEEIRGFEGLKEATINAGGKEVRVAVISGLHNSESIVKKILAGVDVGYDLIEVMACPGGCINGAGHPVPEKIDALTKRQQVLVNIDKKSEYRKSQENPDILRLYDEYYHEPNSHLAHKLLHTSYTVHGGDGVCGAIRPMADSAYVTHEFTVCSCNLCKEKGSIDLYSEISGRLIQSKMDAFVKVRTIRLKENHGGDGIFLTLDGKSVSPDELDTCFKTLRRENR